MNNETQERSKLTNLYSQRTYLQTKKEKLLSQVRPLQREMAEIDNKLWQIGKDIERIENRKLLITTHCIQRAQERIGSHVDEQWIRDNIISEQLMTLVDTLGSGVYPIQDTEYIVKIEDRKMLTIYTKETDDEKRERKKKYRKVDKKVNQ